MTRATLPVLLLAATLASVVPMDVAGDHFYIDPVNGSDTTGNGSEGNPWKTLTHANTQTQNDGTEENPVVLHALPGVYSPSTNGETFPVEFNQGYWGGDFPRVGFLMGSGSGQTILDAEHTEYVLKTWGELITVSDLTITGGSHGGVQAIIDSDPGPECFTLERCVIRDNTGGDGLKVFNAGGSGGERLRVHGQRVRQ